MIIPERYWNFVVATADTYGVDPVQLLETAAWGVLDRCLDILSAQDHANVDVPLSPDCEAMLTDIGPLTALFGHAQWIKAANAIRTRNAQPRPADPDALRDDAGRFTTLRQSTAAIVSDDDPEWA